jgi:histidine triad (HIT) family protein
MEECVFCQIVSGGLPASIVHSTADTLSFLDNRPLFPGHVLVVPRLHHETIEDAPLHLLGSLFGVVQLMSKAVGAALEAPGTFIATNTRVSQSVAHFHVHVVPRRKGDGLRGFFWPRQPYEDSDHQERVRRAIAAAMPHP